jgi:hypothetical protein
MKSLNTVVFVFFMVNVDSACSWSLGIAGELEGLRKALFQHQCEAQESGQLHPKVASLCRQVQQLKSTRPAPHRVLVVVRRDQPTLIKTLQAAISADGAANVADCPGLMLTSWSVDLFNLGI